MGSRPRASMFWAAFLAGRAVGWFNGFRAGLGAGMKVVTQWPALVPAIRRAGHEPVLELPRCGAGYCTSGGPAQCIMRVKGSVECPNFSYTAPPAAAE